MKNTRSRRRFVEGLAASFGCAIILDQVKGVSVASSQNSLTPQLIPKQNATPINPPKQAAVIKLPTEALYGRLPFSASQLWGDKEKDVESMHRSISWRVIGHCEGNLNPDGSKNPNYEGHTDPGNFVHNRGAYSYQFGNEENLSPEESDLRQHAKLKREYSKHVDALAKERGYTAEEVLNFADMINQAPLCVTEGTTMMDRLVEAKSAGKEGFNAILYARVESFKGPSGNYETTFVSREWLEIDQTRRMNCIVRALPQVVAELTGKSPTAKVSFSKPINVKNPYEKTNYQSGTGRFPSSVDRIKAELWSQGLFDKASGLQPMLKEKVYLEGFNAGKT